MKVNGIATSGNVLRPRIENWRMLAVYIIMGGVFGFLVMHLFRLQILEGGQWLAQAVKNRTKEISVASPRGIIYDRNGYVLARNVASYNVVVTPAYLPDDDADIQEIYRQLSALTGVPINQGTVEDAKKVAACVAGPGIAQLVALQDSLAPYSPIQIKCSVDETVARVVREKAVDWPGVSIEVEPIRDYPTGSLTANILGFLGPIPANTADELKKEGFVPGRDKVGYAGVENSFDTILRGTPGKRVVEVDVAGQELRNLEAPVAPLPGDNMYLTLDTRLQESATASVTSWVNYWNRYFGRVRISSAAAIAMNPRTGEILAMVSYPTYENNRMTRFIPAYYYEQLSEDPRHPMLNNAIQTEYPPGSTFKLSTAIGVLNEGIVTPTTVVQTPGKLVVLEKYSPNDPLPSIERPFVDWIYDENPAGFGSLDFLHCIAYSSNVCFYKLGGGWKVEIPEGLDIERIRQYARALGYDQPSGIELFGEAGGLIPTPQWKRINKGENWSTGDTYIATVGQGYVLATPLQVMLSGATIANDGKAIQPTLVREVVNSDGTVIPSWYTPEDNGLGTVSNQAINSRSYQISPFVPNIRWDMTVDPIISDYQCAATYCTATGLQKTVQPWVVEKVQEGMRLAVTDARGTLHKAFGDEPIAYAGKTGTAEYCDDVALKANRCQFGSWPTHSWTIAYAPYDDPEIVVVAFTYNGGEGATVAAPIVEDIMHAYFELKSIDIAQGKKGGG
jgi:penicillin-binding protein 2